MAQNSTREIEKFKSLCGNIQWSISAEEIKQKSDALLSLTKSLHENLKLLPDTVEATNFKSLALPIAENDLLFSDESCFLGFFQHITPNNDARKTASVDSEKALSELAIELSMDKKLFEKYQLVHQQFKNTANDPSHVPTESNLTPADTKQYLHEAARMLDKIILQGKRSGLHLEESVRNQVKELTLKMNSLCIDFQNNVNNENSKFHFSPEELAGCSESFVNSLEKTSDGKLVVTLKYPHVTPIMKLCNVEATRKTINVAFNNRCAPDNSKILQQLTHLRDQRAKLLGYANHASYITEILMSKSSANVLNFINSLKPKLTGLRDKELDRLKQLKKELIDNGTIIVDPNQQATTDYNNIYSYETNYLTNKVEETDYSVDHEYLRQFFDAETTVDKILDIYQRLLSLKFVKIACSTADDSNVKWHENVDLFAVYDNVDDGTNEHFNHADKQPIGYFYLDLFPRDGKYSHAACFTIKHKLKNACGVSAVLANFTPPDSNNVSLLNHNEVETFFHEFGHVMHQLCSKTHFCMFAGTATERDFVEAPSQMLENWLWNKEILLNLAFNQKTQETIPEEVIDKLLISRRANCGLFYMRQIAFASLDMDMHTTPTDDTSALAKKHIEECMAIKSYGNTDFCASFGHLAGGYDARYYGYMWSEVFSADMFESKFEKYGLLNPLIGREYRVKILERGGSVDADDMLFDFLGRQYNDAAFVKLIGGV